MQYFELFTAAIVNATMFLTINQIIEKTNQNIFQSPGNQLYLSPEDCCLVFEYSVKVLVHCFVPENK